MLSLRDPSQGYSDLVESGRSVAVSLPPSARPAVDFLLEHGLLRPGSRGVVTTCSLCGSPHEIDRAGPEGDRSVCTREAGVSVSSKHVLWRADWDALQGLLRRELGTSGAARSLVAGHVAFLGKIGTRNSSFPVWLARGLLRAEMRVRIGEVLDKQPNLASGVVIVACRPSSIIALANAVGLVWLGEVLDLSSDPPSIDVGAVYQRARSATSRPRRPGRPAAPFDAEAVLRRRIRLGQALRTLSAEAKALQTIEAGEALSARPTRIERLIRSTFRAWEASGFSQTFQHDQ